MQARCNHMYLVHNPRRDHMYLAYYMMSVRPSRRDHMYDLVPEYSRDRNRRRT